MTDIDPKWIRVSHILAMIPSQSPDGKWGYPMYNINEGVLQRKADLGTSVHKAIKAHVMNEFIPITDKEEKYFESYLKWEKATCLQPVDPEKRLYDQHMNLTGCIDMLANFKGSASLFITDFKCTVAADSTKWPIQAALYKLLADLNNIKVDNTALFVQLDSNGDMPKVHKYEVDKKLISTAISWYNAYCYLTAK
jgi:hypothetical protein